jgi:ribosomal-protein-alanine N-acetyltransferase
MIVVRRMRWWDVREILPLEGVLFPADPWSAELFWGELAGVPSARSYLVAEENGVVVGYAGLAICGPTADVQTLAVHPQAQGRGVGATLLDALLDEAARRRCSTVLLEVRADNGPAQRLYARFGFQRVGTRPGYYERGRVDAVVLRLRPVRRPVAAGGSR